MTTLPIWLLIICTLFVFAAGTIMGFYIGVYKARSGKHMFFDPDEDEEIMLEKEEVEEQC